MKSKIKRWYEKQSTTVRAALIGGFFVLLASIITGFFETANSNSVIIVQITAPASQVVPMEISPMGPSVYPQIQLPQATEWILPTQTQQPIISVEHRSFFSNIPYVIPQTGSLYNDDVLSKVRESIINNEYKKWPIIPPDNYSLFVRITNITKDHTWVRLDSVFEANVIFSPETGERPNVIYERAGGGGGYTWILEDVNLISFANSYSQSTRIKTYAGIEADPPDYISLQPGEFFEFLYPFNCVDPGTYRTTLKLNYSAGEINDSITIDFPIAECPTNFTYWDVWYDSKRSVVSVNKMFTVVNYDYKSNDVPYDIYTLDFNTPQP